jgi:hypothetical protein
MNGQLAQRPIKVAVIGAGSSDDANAALGALLFVHLEPLLRKGITVEV